MTTWTRQLFGHNPLTIAKGGSNGHSGVHVFGVVPEMSRNKEGSVWDIDDTFYPWEAFNTASVLNIPTVNAADNGDKLTIYGLDADYKPISEEVTLSSTVSVTTTNVYKRFSKAYYTNGGFNVVATGNIDIRVGATVVGRVLAGYAETYNAMYTVPAGYTAFLMHGTMTCRARADGTGNFDYLLFGDNHFRTGHTFEITGDGGQYDYTFSTPFSIPEKTDLDVRIKVRTNNARVTAAYDIVLVNNNNIYR